MARSTKRANGSAHTPPVTHSTSSKASTTPANQPPSPAVARDSADDDDDVDDDDDDSASAASFQDAQGDEVGDDDDHEDAEQEQAVNPAVSPKAATTAVVHDTPADDSSTSQKSATSPLQAKKSARQAKKQAKLQQQQQRRTDPTTATSNGRSQDPKDNRQEDVSGDVRGNDSDDNNSPLVDNEQGGSITGSEDIAQHKDDDQELEEPTTPTAASPSRSHGPPFHSTDDESADRRDEDQDFVADSSNDKRPFSLSSEPETPRSANSKRRSGPTSSSSSRRPRAGTSNSGLSFDSLAAGAQRDTDHQGNGMAGSGSAGASATAAVWRNTMAATGGSGIGMDDVSLSPHEGSHRSGFEEDSDSRASRNGHRPKTDGSEDEDHNAGDDGDDRDAEGKEDSYGFLKARIEKENTLNSSDPALKRQSVKANSAIKESFERMQRAKAQAQAGRGAGVAGALGEAEEDIDWDFWGRVMSNYEEVASTHPRELSRAIQRGIPSALRGMTWQLMAASKDPVLEEMYGELLKQPSTHEKSISRDLNRTFPKHEYFMDAAGVGQENLFNVVKAYSIYDEEVGYTQGLQFIVGPLLLNMPDEEAFCVLVRLMKSYDLRSHYTPNMPGLQLRLFQFDRLLEELLPGVFMHLLRQGIKSSMYASQWFLTLFGYRFPLELVSSVFDLVFAEGVEAIFRFSVAILKKNETKICELEFEDLIEYLKNGLFESYAPDPDDKSPHPLYKAHDFVREALQVKITPLMLDQFGEEWETLSRQQSAHTLELEALRQANLQLSLQVRALEASLSQINTEHCELVKQVVMAKLEREELEDELVKYKIAYADLSHQQASDGASLSRNSFSRSSASGQSILSSSSASIFGFNIGGNSNSISNTNGTGSGGSEQRHSSGSMTASSPDLSRSHGNGSSTQQGGASIGLGLGSAAGI